MKHHDVMISDWQGSYNSMSLGYYAVVFDQPTIRSTVLNYLCVRVSTFPPIQLAQNLICTMVFIAVYMVDS